MSVLMEDEVIRRTPMCKMSPGSGNHLGQDYLAESSRTIYLQPSELE